MRVIKTAIIISLVLGSVCCAQGGGPATRPGARAAVGEALSPTELEMMGGGRRPVVAKGHRATLLAFWATWCQVCKAEIPKLSRLQASQPPDGIEVIGVNAGESARRIKAFLEENELPYSVAVDPEQKLMAIFGVEKLPTFALIDSEGTVRYLGNHLPEGSMDLKGMTASLER
ncbi:MAG TPA: TlpA disulfide reductase family protein [Blastocatellia bacterium]|jgi:thiol-disulfide isomerase/thioredoxin|nr:TlpA disulfide reductase family protein [Blastocatellia bacterium]